MKPRWTPLLPAVRQSLKVQRCPCAKRAFTSSLRRSSDDVDKASKFPEELPKTPQSSQFSTNWTERIQESQIGSTTLGNNSALTRLLSQMGDQTKAFEEALGIGSSSADGEEEEEIDPEMFKLRKPMDVGETYSPHDFSYEEYKKWSDARRDRRAGDIFDKLKEDPIMHYKNFNLLADFVTEMGRIKHRDETGLRGVNQRKMAKAVRRAIGIGLLPSVHKHPELMRMEQRQLRKY